MKAFLLCLCLGGLLAAIPCRAQQPPPVSGAKPLLYVYVVRYGENMLPRIVLGKETPAAKISAFAKCVPLSKVNPKLAGLAVELKPDDAKSLNAAIKQASTKANHESVGVVLWFTTPDDQALDYLSLATSNAGQNLEDAGILSFDTETQRAIVDYLVNALHL